MMYKLLYNTFPRQIAIPYRINCRNELEFRNIVARYNGRKRVYSSIYNYNTLKGPMEPYNIVLDKIFFDFDGENAYDSICAAVKYLLRCGTRFVFFFSGGGFHLYIICTNGRLVEGDKKACLINAQMHYQKLLNLDIDRAVIGDLARVATVPNTFNTKRNRYCIPLTVEDLNKGMEYIKELSRHQVFKLKVYGNEPLDISQFDRECKYEINIQHAYEGAVYDGICSIEGAPDCVSLLLNKGDEINVGWRGRFLIIIYYKARGFIPKQVEELLYTFLTNPYNGLTEGEHCVKIKHQVNDIFEDDRYVFPKCETIKQDGYCPHKGYCPMAGEWGRDHKVKGLYK